MQNAGTAAWPHAVAAISDIQLCAVLHWVWRWWWGLRHFRPSFAFFVWDSRSSGEARPVLLQHSGAMSASSWVAAWVNECCLQMDLGTSFLNVEAWTEAKCSWPSLVRVLLWKCSVIDGDVWMPSVKHLACQLCVLQSICHGRQCASLLTGSSSCNTDGSELGKLKKGKAVSRAQLVWCLWPSLSMPFLFKTYTETEYLQCGQLFLEFLLPPAPLKHHCLGTSWCPPSSSCQEGLLA